jgi:hypothetical protein
MYNTRKACPVDNNYTRVTFLLREYKTLKYEDVRYLCKFPPGTDLVVALGLETLEPITHGKGLRT